MLGFALLLLLVVALIAVSICTGSVKISITEAIDIIRGNASNKVNENIILKIRFPRTIAACVLGGALALSGLMLQTFFHNPIAGPFVLGISSGAKLLVALTMVYALDAGIILNSGMLIIAAFAGAIMSTLFILMLSKAVNRMSLLIVGGVMIGYICTAITDFVVTFADDSNIVNLHNWSKGSFSGITWNNVTMMSVVIGITIVLTFLMCKPMSAYQMGESYAVSLGVNVKLFRVALIILSSILSGTVTAFAGPVSFVGIAVPHIIRSIFKTNKPIITIPACFLGGAVFSLFSDIIARTLFAPTELSISTVTAVFGAPIVIYMLIRRRREVL